MKYETYNSTKHTLEVGTKIRLGGREGEIVLTDNEGGELGYQVEWEKSTHSYLDLSAYPLLEIAISPLTIDKRVKGEIEKRLARIDECVAILEQSMVTSDYITKDTRVYLNSLKET